jgi:poly(3-hydroxyalkanoate) synthetase
MDEQGLKQKKIRTSKEQNPSLMESFSLSHQLWNDLFHYQIDFWQRSVLFFDTLRQRANDMMEHEQQGMPPPLRFTYEQVLDGRNLEPKTNYALLKILEVDDICFKECFDPNKPPVIIVDPRAGHGPGIGGFKRDSEIGIALHRGHAVYFVLFYPEPIPHQTLTDVLATMKQFVEQVKVWHQDQSPILYGNCQAGWMLALLASDCRGLVGPLVMNGSPISYWASSKEEVNPMQLLGGLLGGVWLTRFLSDLNDGILDGAWLVQNFEFLNPTTAIWDKYHHLFDEIDTERTRFLDFEHWWNGFYQFSQEEITETVASLFIGNQLERGEIALHQNCVLDLKRIHNPIVIFASQGDEITPPYQALHWLRNIYPTTHDLKQAKQRIVYLLHPTVGHLGIFVSAKVVRLEHRAILEHCAAIEKLPPGLYEMIIDNPTGDLDCSKEQYKVRFEERELAELCSSKPFEPFEKIRQLSEANDANYRALCEPWVQAISNPILASGLKKMHPMRISRYVFSEKINPPMRFIAGMTKAIDANRLELTKDNVFKQNEQMMCETIRSNLEVMRHMRNNLMESIFESFYDGG